MDARGFPGGSDGEVSACNAGDLGSIPESGRPPGEGNGNPLQYSCLENHMDRGTSQATVQGVTKSWTQVNMHAHTYTVGGNINWCSQCVKQYKVSQKTKNRTTI